MRPTTPAEFRVKVLESDDPGCWANKVLMRRPNYVYERIPSLPELDVAKIWRG
jgi:hypothetical protein